MMFIKELSVGDVHYHMHLVRCHLINDRLNADKIYNYSAVC